MFRKVLIANRGAIACRIQRTLRRLGIAPVAVYSDVDKHSLHVSGAAEAVALGGKTAAESYLRQDKLIEAALATGAEAIHPGYGFLSENAGFAERTEAAGIVFIGPTPGQMRDFGLKHRARALALENGLPLLPGSGLLHELAAARTEAARIGYPVMLKSTAGGGGIGMQLCRSESDLVGAYASVERLARSNFSDGGLFLEKYIEPARHIEVQIFGDGKGRVIALGERDCSMQRRNQKVVEETPAPGLTEATRADLAQAAVRLGRAVNYRSAGTVEFVYDVPTGRFYFLEVNTRLQVEHGVTEEVTGVDLVEWMVRLAAGEEPPGFAQYRHAPRGHAIEVRVYAEDPSRNFRPSSGLLSQVVLPTDVRVDSWIETGTEVSSFYDPLLAKVIAHGPTREASLDKLRLSLAGGGICGIETNLEYLRAILGTDVFRAGRQFTRFLGGFEFQPLSVEVLRAGTQATVQDFPGRLGFWNVGVPPSGPMDDLAFRLANTIVGNPPGAAGLELTGKGPVLQFGVDTVIALAGAVMKARLEGQEVPFWRPVLVKAGNVLALGGVEGPGQRTYLAVKGGFDVPEYLGSRSTFTLGQFGGHVGRALRKGDVLRLTRSASTLEGCESLSKSQIPTYGNHWDIEVTYGPHGAPDFFTEEDIQTFFSTDWEVHYNSSRTGVRLIGPKPQWARADGGEAGLHPSNIHDNAYAIGAIDYTGDMPVILGPDGPSLGGFVCPAVITRADLWKMGQLRPGDTIRFRKVAGGQAVPSLERVGPAGTRPVRTGPGAVLQRLEGAGRIPVCYRHSGEDYLLIEYGPPVLDLELRFRVHALMQWLETHSVPGIIDLTPGIRSLQVHYDSHVLSQPTLCDLLLRAEDALPSIEELEVDSRIVHLPLSWDDPATRLAIEKYMQSVRPDAPWCPSNIEFIRRINGLDSIEDVRRIVFEARYLVMGLGDVYLGAPVATPLDPRHRLVTTKYNPARTWTPENAVGIGGAYLCVYGMEGPGGYQFVGRTVQMWNRYRNTADFRDGKQWLLRFFDQIQFYPVSAAELAQMREDFPYGRFRLDVQETTLRLRAYRAFLQENAASINEFKARQQAAFDAERERWNKSAAGDAVGTEVVSGAGAASTAGNPEGATARARSDSVDGLSSDDTADVPAGCIAVSSPVAGSVWNLSVAPGARVQAGDDLLVIEAMKMEIPIVAEEPAEIVEVRCARGKAVSADETLLILRPL
jgi:urea carboxylase